MEDICLIIDVDGYCVGHEKKFYCRELGYADLSTPFKDYGSVRFDLRPIAKLLIPKDRATVRYIENRLGVLKLWPDRTEVRDGNLVPLDRLNTKLLDLWRKYQRPNKMVVAYKGGHLEKDLLEDLEIPHVNLEDFGCPKYDRLSQDARDCGYHHHVEGPVHCPMKECAAFAEWVRQYVNPPEEWWHEDWWDF